MLVLESANVVGHNGFSVGLADTGKWHGPGQELPLAKKSVPPGQSASVYVRYLATDTTERSAQLVVKSNATNAKTLTVPLIANAKAPCILVKPGKIDFGATLVGEKTERTAQICNCGVSDLVIMGLELGVSRHDNDAEFKLLQTPKLPVTLGINGCETVSLQYAPEDITPIDDATSVAVMMAISPSDNSIPAIWARNRIATDW